MSTVVVEVFGLKDEFKNYNCGSNCSCRKQPSMWQMYNELNNYLRSSKIKGKVKVKFIDVLYDNIDDYPTITDLLKRGYKLPLVIINGVPKFYGGIPNESVYSEINKYLQ